MTMHSMKRINEGVAVLLLAPPSLTHLLQVVTSHFVDPKTGRVEYVPDVTITGNST